jgi:hypothetical protein
MSARPDDEDLLNELAELVREDRREDAMPEGDDVLGPMTSEEQAALTASVLARLEIEAPARSNVVPLAKRARFARTSIAATAIAAAAAAVLGLWPRDPTLPAYTLDAPSPDALLRGERDGLRSEGYAADRELELTLRPATRTDRAHHVAAYVRRSSGWERFAPRAQPLGGGVWLVRVRLGDELRLEPGAHAIAFVVSNEPMQGAEEIGQDARRLEFSFVVR